MPFQVSEGKTASEELGQSLGGVAGLALASPFGAGLFLGGLKLGAKAAWATTKTVAPIAGSALVGGIKHGAGPAARIAGTYLGLGARGARTAVGGSIYGAAKLGGWIYRNPGTALALAAPLGAGMASFSSERAATRGVYASPNMTELKGGTSGPVGINSLMNSMSATGDVVLGMHRRR